MLLKLGAAAMKFILNKKICEIVHGDKIVELYEKVLTEYWLRRQEYPLISKTTLRISVPIVLTNLWKNVFSQLKIIKQYAF